jgi:protease-4
MRALALVLPLVLGAIACEGRPRTTNATSTPSQPHTGPALATFDLSAGVPEQTQPNFLGVTPHHHSFDELVREIERIGKDKRTTGAFVRFGGASMGLARAMELGAALEALNMTKPVFCHAEGYSNATIYAAARGCKRITVAPAGDVEAIGLAAQVVYMRKLLADNLGMSIDFLQVGKYKGAEEPLTRDGPSDEARASLEGTLAGMRDAWLEGLRAARPQADEGSAEDGPYSPQAAKDRGLIDDIGYLDEAREAAKKAVGAVREDARFGAGPGSARGDDLGDILKIIAGESSGSAPVAIVRATGSISMSGGGGLFGGSGGITERELGRVIARLEKDDDVKAVVLRIDSPGGSALASDLIWHGLMKLRAKKPVVVSVGDMAASGGYYLACTGSEIFADDASIVGSIGVVGGKIGLGKTLEKIGVHAETFPAKKGDPKALARAAYLSPLVGWDDATRARVLETMTGIYDLFLARIVEGRAGKISIEKLKESAEGRIFSGREAKARGLVDVLGGLSAAIVRAKELAKLPADARVATVGQRSGLLDALAGDDGDDDTEERAAARQIAESIATMRAPLAWIGESAPELVPFATSFAPLVGGERTLAALPFAIVLR